jgi:hypothetical protein
MDAEERQALIESYGRAHETLDAALARFPQEMWQWRPADGWSIHEIIVHVTDSEANSFARCRRFIAEPEQELMAYDEAVWAKALDYHSQSTELAVELFRWLRRASYELVRGLPEATWANRAYHPESGWMTMDDWLVTYERHVRVHVEQMEGVFAEWQQGQGA